MTVISFSNGKVLINGIVETDPLKIGYTILDLAEEVNELESEDSDLNSVLDSGKNELIQN